MAHRHTANYSVAPWSLIRGQDLFSNGYDQFNVYVVSATGICFSLFPLRIWDLGDLVKGLELLLW